MSILFAIVLHYNESRDRDIRSYNTNIIGGFSIGKNRGKS